MFCARGRRCQWGTLLQAPEPFCGSIWLHRGGINIPPLVESLPRLQGDLQVIITRARQSCEAQHQCNGCRDEVRTGYRTDKKHRCICCLYI